MCGCNYTRFILSHPRDHQFIVDQPLSTSMHVYVRVCICVCVCVSILSAQIMQEETNFVFCTDFFTVTWDTKTNSMVNAINVCRLGGMWSWEYDAIESAASNSTPKLGKIWVRTQGNIIPVIPGSQGWPHTSRWMQWNAQCFSCSTKFVSFVETIDFSVVVLKTLYSIAVGSRLLSRTPTVQSGSDGCCNYSLHEWETLLKAHLGKKILVVRCVLFAMTVTIHVNDQPDLIAWRVRRNLWLLLENHMPRS